MTVERVALDEVARLIADRRLVDAKTIIGLMLARRRPRTVAERRRPGGTSDAPDALPARRRCRSTSRSTSPGWPSSGAARVNTLAAYRRDLRRYWAWLRAGETSASTRCGGPGPRRLRAAMLARRGLAPGRRSTRALVAVRSFHRFRAEEGLLEHRPGRGGRGPAGAPGAPEGAHRGRGRALLDAVVGDDPVARRDRAILETLYGTGVRISELVGLDSATSTSTAGWCGCWARAPRSGWCPLGRCARERPGRLAGPAAAARMAPSAWARRGDAEAVFLNQRGGRLDPAGAW